MGMGVYLAKMEEKFQNMVASLSHIITQFLISKWIKISHIGGIPFQKPINAHDL